MHNWSQPRMCFVPKAHLLAAVLMGPLSCTTYLLNQGLLAATLGACWAKQVHWGVSVPVGALVRVGGSLLYIALSSWTMNENLFALLMSNIYSLLVGNQTSCQCFCDILEGVESHLRASSVVGSSSWLI